MSNIFSLFAVCGVLCSVFLSVEAYSSTNPVQRKAKSRLDGWRGEGVSSSDNQRKGAYGLGKSVQEMQRRMQTSPVYSPPASPSSAYSAPNTPAVPAKPTHIGVAPAASGDKRNYSLSKKASAPSRPSYKSNSVTPTAPTSYAAYTPSAPTAQNNKKGSYGFKSVREMKAKMMSTGAYTAPQSVPSDFTASNSFSPGSSSSPSPPMVRSTSSTAVWSPSSAAIAPPGGGPTPLVRAKRTYGLSKKATPPTSNTSPQTSHSRTDPAGTSSVASSLPSAQYSSNSYPAAVVTGRGRGAYGFKSVQEIRAKMMASGAIAAGQRQSVSAGDPIAEASTVAPRGKIFTPVSAPTPAPVYSSIAGNAKGRKGAYGFKSVQEIRSKMAEASNAYSSPVTASAYTIPSTTATTTELTKTTATPSNSRSFSGVAPAAGGVTNMGGVGRKSSYGLSNKAVAPSSSRPTGASASYSATAGAAGGAAKSSSSSVNNPPRPSSPTTPISSYPASSPPSFPAAAPSGGPKKSYGFRKPNTPPPAAADNPRSLR